MKQQIRSLLNSHLAISKSLYNLIPEIEKAATLIIETFKRNNKLLVFGNGGSAADAQHIAAEMVVRFYKNRNALPSIALTTDSSILTACGNDFSFDNIFARQIEALANPYDCLLAISTSGTSSNIIKAAQLGKKRQCKIICFTGNKVTTLTSMSDVAIAVDCNDTPRIQEAHITIAHIICQLVEESLSIKN